MLAGQENLQFCVSESVDDFMGLPCAIKRTGNALSISCDATVEVYASCFETTHIEASGTASSDHYELSGTIEVSDSPLACSDSTYCWSFTLTLDKTGSTPTACAYADVNTIALTVDTGPATGPHTLHAFGNLSGGPGAYSFNFSGNDAPPIAGGPAAPEIVINVQTPPLDPATLPVDLPITVLGPRAEASEPFDGVGALVYYYENVIDYDYAFSAESATGGTLRVEELDVDHIAGTLAVTMDGTAYYSRTPTPETHTISGGYFVRRSNVIPNSRSAVGFFSARLRDVLAAR